MTLRIQPQRFIYTSNCQWCKTPMLLITFFLERGSENQLWLIILYSHNLLFIIFIKGSHNTLLKCLLVLKTWRVQETHITNLEDLGQLILYPEQLHADQDTAETQNIQDSVPWNNSKSRLFAGKKEKGKKKAVINNNVRVYFFFFS